MRQLMSYPGASRIRACVQLEGDFSIVPRKANEILRAPVKRQLLRTVYLKLCWATPRTAPSNRHGSGVEVAELEGELGAALTQHAVFTVLNDYGYCAQSAKYAALTDEEKQRTLQVLKREITEGRNLTPDAWTPASLLRAGVVYQQFDHVTGDFASYFMDALRKVRTTEELLQCLDQFRVMYISSTFAGLPGGTQRQLLNEMKSAAITARVRVTSEEWSQAVIQAYASALDAAHAIVPSLPTDASL
jgi:hypothetical protein